MAQVENSTLNDRAVTHSHGANEKCTAIISKGNWNRMIFFLLCTALCFRSHNYISAWLPRASHLKRRQFPTLFTGIGSILRTFTAHTLCHVLFLPSSVGEGVNLPSFKHVHSPSGDLHSNVWPAKLFPEQ